ncbi:DUF192 domain-containing protein [Lysobacter pythonis]|uniref:DUF192 domain-containing protein n=1 Tax=Solilutibacter pythonis TaxID=2483112 RepID=A0A3M2I5U3_9GAMM|nr:DUF192 domain-containing protein [Lysobacter pythonis]RMH93827.1 DUF192 domain-containing protein [Lysobacter pythonis]
MKRGLIRRDSGGIVVARVWLANRWWSRLRGLLLRPHQEALLLTPCASVHTFGMHYPLDLVFLDRQGRVCGWQSNLRPWRTATCRGAAATVEMHAGTLGTLAPRIGEHWEWQATRSQ